MALPITSFHSVWLVVTHVYKNTTSDCGFAQGYVSFEYSIVQSVSMAQSDDDQEVDPSREDDHEIISTVILPFRWIRNERTVVS